MNKMIHKNRTTKNLKYEQNRQNKTSMLATNQNGQQMDDVSTKWTMINKEDIFPVKECGGREKLLMDGVEPLRSWPNKLQMGNCSMVGVWL